MTYNLECHPSSPCNSSTTFSSSTPCHSSSLEASSDPKIHYQSNNTKRLRLPQPNKYKGVVPQPNGRWGAQLYEASKRVWVGTFDTQELAARAYDTAVVRFRGPHAATNFPIRYYISVLHLEFQASHTKARIIDMLRAHTYHDELSRFMRARIAMNRRKRSGQNEVTDHSSVSNAGSLERLFEKVLTPSDVGRLHRLVIPKQYAERYLPRITIKGDDTNVTGIMLSVEDKMRNKMWRFKYCYWSSSQNFVLTKGWGEFVKDRGLKSGDIVSFYTLLGSSDNRLYIDASSRPSSVDHESCNTSDAHGGSDGGTNGGADECGLVMSSKMLRLFGVDMSVNHLHKSL